MKELLALALLSLFACDLWKSESVHSRLFMVRVDTLYGYINQSGQVVINPQYRGATDFSEGLARVAGSYQDSLGPRWGFMMSPARRS